MLSWLMAASAHRDEDKVGAATLNLSTKPYACNTMCFQHKLPSPLTGVTASGFKGPALFSLLLHISPFPLLRARQ